MAVKLNLLPSDYALTGSVSTSLKAIKSLNVVLLGIFLAAALGMTVFLVFSSISLNNLNSVNSRLKTQIQSQQSAQQQAILLKDRLVKIKEISKEPSATNNFAGATSIFNALSDFVTISELNLDSEKVNMTLGFKTNTELNEFVKSLENQTAFSNVTLNSFGLNPVSGYLVEFTLSK